MTKPPIATGRLAWTVIAITFVVAAITVLIELKQMSVELWQIANARPVNIAIDFSKPGEIKVPYRQAYTHSQGEILELQLSPKLLSDENPREILSELAGEVVIASVDGKPVLSKQFNKESIGAWCSEDEVLLMLAGLSSFPIGEYEMTIRVDTGAEYLADIKQRLVVRYAICRCEMATVAIVGGSVLIGAIVIVLTITLCVLPGLIRHGIRMPQAQSIVQSANCLSDESSGA